MVKYNPFHNLPFFKTLWSGRKSQRPCFTCYHPLHTMCKHCCIAALTFELPATSPSNFGLNYNCFQIHVSWNYYTNYQTDLFCMHLFFLSSSYPLLRLPLPGTGPVEFTTGIRDYSVPSGEAQGDLGEQPDWVSPGEKLG